MARNIKVIKNQENPETPEVLADSIVRISNAFDKLMSSELKQSALVALLRDMPGMTGIGKIELDLILSNLKKLKSYYIRSKI